MLTSGWIMPDGTEISTTEHEAIVRSFLGGLSKNPEVNSVIRQRIDCYFGESKDPSSMLCDFATQVLGWIKVGSLLEKAITYGGYEFQESIVLPYVLYRYYDDNRCYEDSPNYFLHGYRRYMPLECEWIKIINDGKSR